MWATNRHRLLRAAPRWSHGEEITHCEGHCQEGRGGRDRDKHRGGRSRHVHASGIRYEPLRRRNTVLCVRPRAAQGPDREPGAIVLGAHRWPRALHALGLTTNALLRLLRRSAPSSTEVVRSDRAVLPGPSLRTVPRCAGRAGSSRRPGVARWACVGPVRGQRGLMAPFARQPSPQRSTPSLCPHCGQQDGMDV